jgi:putative membrane-bound dehydrogenase-like protein
MNRRPFTLCLACLLTVNTIASSQVPPEKAESTFTVVDGLEFKLWASEPLFVNPTCMDIDHKGRVWVCESVNYRNRLHRKPKLNRPEGDRIVILEDTKGTGRADKATTFYQSPELLAPLGIAVAKDPVGPGYKVFVCQSPDILVFENKDGDGKADGPPKKLLTGFGGYDHDHGVHGILIGPDMKLYFSVGDQGVKDLQSSDGKGRKWTSNNTDCRAGTIWRCDLDGKNLELIAHNFRNEYEPCVDSFGTVFTSDNDDDGNQQTRICYVMPGGNYGYHPRGPGQTHWHEEQPGVVPKILRTYFGSPTGMCVYEGTLLPKKYWGQLLHTDAGPRHVRCYHLKENGAGYDVDREDMVTSTDNWFRPSDVCVAPDGSVFVADWYDPGVGGHGMGDTTRGRIYRLAPKGHKYQVPKVDLESKDGILAALGSPNLAVRYIAMSELNGDPKKRGEVLETAILNTRNPWLRARALWQFQRHWYDSDKSFLFFASLLADDEDDRFRSLGVRALREITIALESMYGDRKNPLLKACEGSYKYASSTVRREVLLALRDIDPSSVKDLILKLARGYDGTDRFYLNAIGIAVGTDPKRRGLILADFEKYFPEWHEEVADLVWELRPASVMPTLGKRLIDAKLPAAQRARIVDILAASEDKDAGKAMLKVLATDVPPEVRYKVIENLKLFLPGKWRELRSSPELNETLNALLHRIDLRPYALDLIVAAEKVDAVVAVEQIANNSANPEKLRNDAVVALGSLPTMDAVRDLQDPYLKLRPAVAIQALGLHAQRRPNLPEAAAALKTLQAVVLDAKQKEEWRAAAVEALAGSRAGSDWLLKLHDKKELPEELKGPAGRLLRNSPHQDLRNRAMLAFPAPGKLDPKKLPSPASLAARRGDANRGKQFLAASVKNDVQCLKCHTVRGVGGAIGPDLSVIGKKASRENLFESILYPSKAIADQYVQWQIETKKGQVVSGLIVEETPDFVTLRDANGKDTKIDKKEIDSRTKSPKSLMPEDLLAYMTEDDLVDTVEYLFALKTPALSMDFWHVAGPFDNGEGDTGLDKVFPPEKSIDQKATYDGKSGKVTWRTVKPDGQGYVDLQAFFAGNSNNIVSYLYRDVESPTDQEATVLMGTDDCSKLWVNSELVHINRQHRAAAPEQDTVKVKLKKGTNRILLKITNGDGAHGFYLTLLAEQELKRIEGK